MEREKRMRGWKMEESDTGICSAKEENIKETITANDGVNSAPNVGKSNEQIDNAGTAATPQQAITN